MLVWIVGAVSAKQPFQERYGGGGGGGGGKKGIANEMN